MSKTTTHPLPTSRRSNAASRRAAEVALGASRLTKTVAPRGSTAVAPLRRQLTGMSVVHPTDRGVTLDVHSVLHFGATAWTAGAGAVDSPPVSGCNLEISEEPPEVPGEFGTPCDSLALKLEFIDPTGQKDDRRVTALLTLQEIRAFFASAIACRERMRLAGYDV